MVSHKVVASRILVCIWQLKVEMVKMGSWVVTLALEEIRLVVVLAKEGGVRLLKWWPVERCWFKGFNLSWEWHQDELRW